MKKSALFGVMGALLVVAACATGKEEQVEASSEIIYEDAPADATPSDPFANCKGQLQQGATVLQCDSVVVVYVAVPARMSEAQIEQNFQSFDQSFPKESTRERFTQEFDGNVGTGMRVFEESQVAPFRAEMLMVPIGENQTKVTSCAVRGSTDFTRCSKIVNTLITQGVPENIEGLPKPVEDAGMMMDADGGMMMDADAGMADAGMATTGAADAGTTTKRRKAAADAGTR